MVTEWHLAHARCEVFKLREIEGVVAIRVFLNAVMERIAPEWARHQIWEVIRVEVYGREQLSLLQYARWMSALLDDNMLNPKASDTKQAKSTKTRSQSAGYACPCLPPGRTSHPWALMSCQNLKKAWSGENGPRAQVSKKACGLIREQLKEAKWSELASSGSAGDL